MCEEEKEPLELVVMVAGGGMREEGRYGLQERAEDRALLETPLTQSRQLQ